MSWQSQITEKVTALTNTVNAFITNAKKYFEYAAASFPLNGTDLMLFWQDSKLVKVTKDQLAQALSFVVQNINRLISGDVVWLPEISNFTYRSIHLNYELNGQPLESHLQDATCATPDTTHPRKDTFYLDIEGLKIATGTPSATPAEPLLPDPSNNIRLFVVDIPANATEPEDVVLHTVFSENAGSPTEADVTITTVETGGIISDNTTNAVYGTYDVKTINPTNGDTILFDFGSTYFQLTDFNHLRMKFKSLGYWELDNLRVTLLDDGDYVTSEHITTASLDTLNTTTIQDVYLFGDILKEIIATQFNQIEFKIQGGNAHNQTIKALFQLDEIKIQTGSDTAVGTGRNQKLVDLLDVDGTDLADGRIIFWNATTGKFEFKDESGGNGSISTSTSNTLLFDNSLGTVHGTFDIPITGDLVVDDTNAVDGSVVTIIWRGATFPNITGIDLEDIYIVGEITEEGIYSIYCNYLFGVLNVNVFNGVSYPNSVNEIDDSGFVTLIDVNGVVHNTSDIQAVDGDPVKKIIATGSNPVDFSNLVSDYPEFKTSQLNGFPAIRLVKGHSKLIAESALGLSAKCTIMGVAMSTTAMTSTNEAYIGTGLSNRLQINIDTRDIDGRVMGLCSVSAGSALLQTNNRVSASEWKVQCISYDEDVNFKGYENGVLEDEVSLSNSNFNDNFVIGSSAASTGLTGYITILYFWDKVLTDAEVLSYSQELMTKFGLS